MANSDENRSSEVNPYAEEVIPHNGYNRAVEIT
jgi:hypothetical protein